jgi:hypothetical protein
MLAYPPVRLLHLGYQAVQQHCVQRVALFLSQAAVFNAVPVLLLLPWACRCPIMSCMWCRRLASRSCSCQSSCQVGRYSPSSSSTAAVTAAFGQQGHVQHPCVPAVRCSCAFDKQKEEAGAVEVAWQTETRAHCCSPVCGCRCVQQQYR